MLANSIWLAAAAQVLCSVFGPERTDRRVAESNLDLLRSTFRLYAAFWDIDPSLQERLDSLETSLQGLKGRGEKQLQQRERVQEGTVLQNGTISGMERMIGEEVGIGQDALDPMILGNDLGYQMSPFDAFVDPGGDAYNPFTIDLDDLFAYGYA